jgi:hypothetical protein
MQTLCSIPIDHTARGILFITLTYPADFPGEWTEWKRHLDVWLHRVVRKFPRAAGVWKLEPQQRGAPHFHLLVLGVPFIAGTWLSRTWFEVVGSGDVRHLRAGTNVQLARSHKGVLAYAAKYTSKSDALPPGWRGGVGRFWGVFHRAALGIRYEEQPITQAQFYASTRILRSLISHRQRAAGRSPPRACSNGMWAVVRDVQAARILQCVNA